MVPPPQLVDVQVTLHWLEVSRGSVDSTVAAAVAQCLRKVWTYYTNVLIILTDLTSSINKNI